MAALPCLAGARRRLRSADTRVIVPTCGVLALLAGVHLGAYHGSSARRACTTELRSGDAVLAQGTTSERATPGLRVRLTLHEVAVAGPTVPAGCRLDHLVVYVHEVIEPVVAGQRVAVRGEWIRLGLPGRWPRRPGRGSIVTGRLSILEPAQPGARERPGPGRALSILRARASDRLRALVPGEASVIARALVLAERDDLPGTLRRRFTDAGMAHLLAISGLHVGIIAAMITGLLAMVVPRPMAGGGAAVLVWAYVLAIGAPPSAVRAAVLFTGWAFARTRGRPARTWDLLGAAALLAVITDPLALTEPGLQLSFAGFIGLGAGASLWSTVSRSRCGRGVVARGRRVGIPEPVRRGTASLALSGFAGFGAFAATGPIAAAHFGQVAPVAVLSNLVGAPLAAAAIGSLAMSLAFPRPLAEVAGAAAAVVLSLLERLAGWFAALPGGHTATAPPGPVAWIALLVCGYAVYRLVLSGRPRRSLVPIAGAAAVLLGGPALSARLHFGEALLCTLDVGQGDAAVLRTQRGSWIVFDAGPAFGRRDAGRDVVLPIIRRHGGREVELFVLSHPDLDHLGGFSGLLDGMPVKRALDSGDPLPKPGYLRFLARVEEEGVLWMAGSAGDRLVLEDVGLTVLGPARDDPRHDTRRANETSLQVRVTVGGRFVYLNTGDAAASDEASLLSRWPADSMRADLLKVGHHGSRSSSTGEWLRAVSPTLAVISAGRGNAYGHPHPTVLRRLGAAGIPRVWRTDRDGTLCVEIRPDGRWRIAGEREWLTASGTSQVLTSQKGEE